MASIEIERLFIQLHITSKYAGYQLLAEALEILLEDPDNLPRANALFSIIGERFQVSPISVRDNIETLIKVSWKRNPQRIQEIAGYPLSSPPSVKRFLEIAANYLIRIQ